MPDRKELEKLAAESMVKSCEAILGPGSQCKLPLEKFERGETDFSGFVAEMEQVFVVLEPVEKVEKKEEEKKEFGPLV